MVDHLARRVLSQQQGVDAAERAKEKGKLEKCVQTWLAKCYGNKGASPCDQLKLSKCRVKYGKVWDKLPKIGDCSGPRFVDNGDSVTDKLTGLIWEKKTDDRGVQDKDNLSIGVEN